MIYRNKDEKLQHQLDLARKSKILYWAENKLKWRPKVNKRNNRIAWYQMLLLACAEDGVYRYPDDFPISDPRVNLRGRPVRKFAWRIGRQAGKSECLSVIALYLSICKPVRWSKEVRYKDHNLISETNPTGWSKRDEYFLRGAKTIVASADATKVKLVFDRVKKLINESPEYAPMLDAKVIDERLHPYPELTFHAEGWTEPAVLSFRGPGANGQALRGSTFDYKLYDEVDYMPASFFEAELATTINAGESALTILSSTPSGKREQFYKACFDADAPVLMHDGTFQPIQNINIGDQVINRYGVVEPVTDIMNRKFSGWVASFTTTLNSVIVRATVNHRFMAVRGDTRYCVACSSIVWENRTTCPVYGVHTDYAKLEPEYINIGSLNLGDFLAIPKEQIKNPKLIGYHHADEKFIYVIIDSYKKSRVLQEQVYNLTVGKDHSYCVNYYGVANCTNTDWGYEEFHFPSWENPSYDATMDKEFRDKYTTTTYEHEILADWGTVEQGVFNWIFFKDVFDYKYKVKSKEEKFGFDEFTLLKLDQILVQKIGVNNLGSWFHSKLKPKNDLCKYYFGADLGYASDPSEFVIFEQFNGVMKMVLRIHLENISYDVQCDTIAFLDKHFMFDMLGMDEGNSGLAVKQILTSDIFDGNGYNKYASHNFKDRLIAVQFGQKVSIGNVAGKDQLVPVKQWMTDLIIKQAEERLLIMPNVDYDPDVENQFRNHTYSIGSNGTVVYSKSDMYPDHVIDAVRTAFNAKCSAMLPKRRRWIAGSSFKSRGAGGWR